MNVTGIIMAGGKSSRMGTDKGLLKLKGKTLVQYQIETLRSLNIPIIIIAHHEDYKQFGYPVYKDIIPEKGPLGGIYTALTHSKTEKNIVLSCDSPFVSIELIELLISKSETTSIVLTEHEKRVHPLIGIYSKAIIPALKSSLDQNKLKMIEFCKTVDTEIVDMSQYPALDDKKIYSNFNTQEEFVRVEAQF